MKLYKAHGSGLANRNPLPITMLPAITIQNHNTLGKACCHKLCFDSDQMQQLPVCTVSSYCLF